MWGLDEGMWGGGELGEDLVDLMMVDKDLVRVCV